MYPSHSSSRGALHPNCKTAPKCTLYHHWAYLCIPRRQQEATVLVPGPLGKQNAVRGQLDTTVVVAHKSPTVSAKKRKARSCAHFIVPQLELRLSNAIARQ